MPIAVRIRPRWSKDDCAGSEIRRLRNSNLLCSRDLASQGGKRHTPCRSSCQLWDYPVSCVHRLVVRALAVLSVMFVAQTVVAGMPRFPVKPLPPPASPPQCNIQPASSALPESKRDPYSDFSDRHGEVVAMALSGSGSKRTNQRAYSRRDTNTNLICPVVPTAADSHLLQFLYPSDPSSSRLGVVMRC